MGMRHWYILSVAFPNALAALIEEPTSVQFPKNIPDHAISIFQCLLRLESIQT